MKIRRKKNVKKGIQFCIMVCGASGTGKPYSTAETAIALSLANLCVPLEYHQLLTPSTSNRTHHLCEHSLRQTSPSRSRLGRRRQCASRRRSQDQASHCRYAATCPQDHEPHLLNHRGYLLMSHFIEIELELDEEGTRISLTVVDTPGFGDQIDNEARYLLPRCEAW